jgi:hypothetical protein
VEWQGQLYHVDPARAELLRLTRARARQGGRSLDEVLTAALLPRGNAEKASELAIAEILASIVYAANLGDPEGSALAAGNVAIRHDLSGPGHRPLLYSAWKLPQEEPGAPGGWRLTGSLLGSEVPLAKLALRWLDTGGMPPAPRVTSTERQIAALTVRLMSPFVVSDEGRDEIRSAIGRGRARVAALTADREQIERIARDGGLSEWRREALAWTITNEPGRVSLQFSLLELLWLGAPRDTAAVGLDAWGAATLPQSGCLCLEMPRPGAEDHLSGRPVSGVLTARGAEVGLRIAEALSELKLPAALAPGVLAFAMQDVLDSARLAYYDDWTEFSRAASALDDVQIADYVSALAAGGPFIPADRSDRRP